MSLIPAIEFYILEDGNDAQALSFICQLIEKAFDNHSSIYIHTSSLNEAETLDNLLWTFKKESFLPHAIYQAEADNSTPIQIGFSSAPLHQQQLLVNLTAQIPAFYKQFNHLFEIVCADSSLQQSARDRYRHYRDQGHDIKTHKLKVT